MEAAALMGAPMRADEVEDLLRSAQQAKVESTIRQEQEDSDDPTPPYVEGGSSDRLPVVDASLQN